jgi:hypothetical protein
MEKYFLIRTIPECRLKVLKPHSIRCAGYKPRRDGVVQYARVGSKNWPDGSVLFRISSSERIANGSGSMARHTGVSRKRKPDRADVLR